MALRVAGGTILVLLSWAVLALIVAGVGRWAAILIDPGRTRRACARGGLWWGLGLITLLVLAMSLFTGLGRSAAGWVTLGVALALAGVGVLIRPPRRPNLHRPRPAVLTVLLAYGAAVIYLALKALGPVTNYDTGLYHLGSIKYAFDFSAVPGIATLYFPFGYANAQFPLAALLGNGPWEGIGYRLLNGLLVVLVASEVTLRLLSRRRSWGSYVLVVGFSAVLIPLIGMADSLVASPTSDTAVLLLTLVATAYMADLLERRGPAALEVTVVIVTTGLTVAMRPTMLVFAAGMVTVLAVTLARHRAARPRGWIPWVLAIAWSVTLVVLVALRDRVLSGWLLYPLSVLPLDVPWRVPDPTGWREATLAAARDPLAPDQYVVAHSWTWVGAWIARLPSQWEFWYLIAGTLAAIVVGVVAHRRSGFPRRPRLLLLSLLPGSLAVLAWFTVSPPSFRFIWGPLFCLLFLVLGSAFRDLARGSSISLGGRDAVALLLVGAAAAVLVVTGYSAIARNQVDQITENRAWSLAGLSLPYAIAPVPLPPVAPVTMRSGLVVFTPASGNEQCWDNYPLCSFSMGDDVALRGATIQDGFTRRR